MPRLYRALLGVGAVATAAPLAADVALGRPLAVPQDLLVLPFSAVYVAGAVAFWRRPDQVAAQRLLASGTFMVLGASLGHFISLGVLAFGATSWFWPANALMQAALLLGAASSVALFAVFPDGRYQRAYEPWVVRAHFAAAPLLPLALLVSLPDLRVDSFMVWTRVNVLKHASASRAAVRLSHTEDALRVEVADEGRGFCPDDVPRSGLLGIRDRVEALGGRLEVISAPGRGARLVAQLPARERDA